MIKFFLNSLRRRAVVRQRVSNQAWHCDPLAHPVLDRMSPAELGDLPLGNVRYNCG
jgi:hypothetical protein